MARPNTVTVKYGSSDQQRSSIAYVTRVLVHPSFVLRYYGEEFSSPTLTPLPIRDLVYVM